MIVPYGCSVSGNICLFYRGPLSQWWFSPFEIEGISYNCAEQFMMAKKAELFGDEKTVADVMQATGPFLAQHEWNQYPRRQQRLGREVRNFSQELWERRRLGIVTTGNLAKFRQHPELANLLKSTAGWTLAEASPVDRIWGIGLSQADSRAFDPENWNGLNLLGSALTTVRAELLTEEGLFNDLH